MGKFIPLFIGLILAISLYLFIGWWGFLIIFPWIGISITLGHYLRQRLQDNQKSLGRKISILLIMPILLVFVPFVNNENFQLEGVILIVLVGFFSKGFIHFAIAKLFGPLIWGRGFCGWACWTAAILDWLPINKGMAINPKLKNIRYLTLALSVLFPVMLIFLMSYDVRGSYINKAELKWMIAGNVIYYFLAIPMAFYFKDKRAFCKVACPVSLIMKAPASFAIIRKRPTENKCIECGICNKVCLMDNDVMSCISRGQPVLSTECILCNECAINCQAGAIR